MALWRFPEPDDEATLAEGGACCALSGVQEIVRLDPAGAPIFSLAVDGAAPGSDPRNPDERQQVRARTSLCAVRQLDGKVWLRVERCPACMRLTKK